MCIIDTYSDDAQRHVEIVLDDDVADMFRQRVEDGDEVAPLGRRQAGRRLVEQDEARRAGQRQRDLQLPLLAVRQRRHQPVPDALQMHGVEDRFRPAPCSRPRRPAWTSEKRRRDAPAGEEDRIQHRQALEQLRYR